MLRYRLKIQDECLAVLEKNSENDFFIKQFVLYDTIHIPQNFRQYTLCFISNEKYMWKITGVISRWETELGIV